MISNTFEQTDLSRPVDTELLDEIQARLDAGWRIRNDMQLLLDFARSTLQGARERLNEARCTTCGRVCQGVSCPKDGCSQSHSPVSQDSLG